MIGLNLVHKYTCSHKHNSQNPLPADTPTQTLQLPNYTLTHLLFIDFNCYCIYFPSLSLCFCFEAFFICFFVAYRPQAPFYLLS